MTKPYKDLIKVVRSRIIRKCLKLNQMHQSLKNYKKIQANLEKGIWNIF